MNLLFDAVGAGIVALAGALFGYLFSRLPKPYWALGYLIALVLILVFDVANHSPEFSLIPAVSWVVNGRKKFAIFGFITTMVLTTPLSRLPRKRDRAVVCVFMAVIVSVTAIWPFLAPLFNRNELLHLKTTIDRNGVCLQGTGYTCGPAAAVTALRKLGFSAEEGKLAVLSYTSSATGTPDDILTEALQKEYGRDGLIAEDRVFKDIPQLKQAGLTLAVVRFGLFVDHYVTVLEVTDSKVVVGDPAEGLQDLSYDEFLKKWRFTGVVLRRR